ncbi:amidase [Dongia sedimenti]|uniref:Amidase n=1 Tax=Dongia sedimenti TaxID=3064282 RepID=A0ABU0YF40_9PROT|nr:amidase [Rhodospirillaceae bacterium R-7]
MATPIHLLPATRLLELYAARELSPVEATKAALTAIDRYNPRFNAFCLVDHDCALNYARQSEARWRRGAPLGPLDGVPTSVKDLILALGWPTLRGSRTIDPDQDWNDDAVAVGSLRRSGAVLLGKTATPEFGWKGVTDSLVHGITRNPWKVELTPGGSSGGAAVAAACGMGALHVGTDGGGSIRIPASFTGVVGFKPTYGIVPRHPPSPYGTLSTAGAITRTVTDAALLMDVLSEPFPLDFYALPHERRSFRAGLDDGVAGWRIAFSPTLSGARVDAEIARLVAAAARRFTELGATVVELPPVIEDCLATFQYHWFVGAALQLRGLTPAQRRLLDPGFAHIAEQGSRLTAVDYAAAVKAREALGSKMLAFFQNWDLLLTPTMPLAAFAAGIDYPPQADRGQWNDWTPFTYPFNLTRQPAASVPCGFTKGGLPAGLQIVGPVLGDQRVLRAARAFEQVQPFRMPDL